MHEIVRFIGDDLEGPSIVNLDNHREDRELAWGFPTRHFR